MQCMLWSIQNGGQYNSWSQAEQWGQKHLYRWPFWWKAYNETDKSGGYWNVQWLFKTKEKNTEDDHNFSGQKKMRRWLGLTDFGDAHLAGHSQQKNDNCAQTSLEERKTWKTQSMTIWENTMREREREREGGRGRGREGGREREEENHSWHEVGSPYLNHFCQKCSKIFFIV